MAKLSKSFIDFFISSKFLYGKRVCSSKIGESEETISLGTITFTSPHPPRKLAKLKEANLTAPL